MSPLALLPPARAASDPRSKLRGVAIAGIGVVLAAGVMIGISLWPARQATTNANLHPSAAYKPSTGPATVSAASVQVPAPAPLAPPANAGAKLVGNSPSLPAAGALSSNKSPSNQSPGAGSSMEIVLNATEPSWISMKDQDGQDLFAQLLVPGSARTFNLQGGGTLRTGNAGGLAVRLNGNPIGPLGPAGKIREVRFRNGGFTITAP
jgi:cytoskeletal protein RodZ